MVGQAKNRRAEPDPGQPGRWILWIYCVLVYGGMAGLALLTLWTFRFAAGC